MATGPGFTNLFGGGSVLPAFPMYLALAISANTVLEWPTETNTGNGLVVPEILEITALNPSLAIQFSDATIVGNGYSALINNVGANAFAVKDDLGNNICSVASGTVWQVYLADNTTPQGTWRAFQFGAGVSQANASALAGAGIEAIGLTLNADIAISPQTNNYNIQNSDRASLIEWTGTGAGTLTLPSPAAVGSNWFCYVRNSGGASITVAPPSGTLNGAANLTFNANDSAIIVCDGTNFWTIGYGQAVTSTFTFTTINLAGVSGTYTLAGANLNKTSYKFTGALAGNTTVVVPASVAQYWADNETTGSFTLTFQSSGTGGSTYTLGQGNRMILYCDGLNITPAVTLSSGTPTFPDGSAGSPSITFASDGTMGFYKAGADTLGIATGGKSRATVNAAGDWVFGNADSGITVTVNGVANQNAFEVLSGNSATGALSDLLVERAGSTANNVSQGPSMELLDTTSNDGLVLQISGGQIEIWEKFNNGAWFQVAVFDTAGNMKVMKNLTVEGTLTSVGAATLQGTLQVTGAVTVNNTVTATGGYNT